MNKFSTRLAFTLQKIKYGISVGVNPTTRCNLDCDYCASSIFLGEHPVFKKELNVQQWLIILLNHKPRINIITISGGEPAIYRDIVPLVNYLAKMKIAVRILTNLTSKRLLEIDKSPYVRIYTTFHYGYANMDKFMENLKLYKEKFVVAVNELEGKPKMIKESKIKLLETFDKPERVSSTPEGDDLTYCRLNKCVMFIPDGRVVSSGHEKDLLADNYTGRK